MLKWLVTSDRGSDKVGVSHDTSAILSSDQHILARTKPIIGIAVPQHQKSSPSPDFSCPQCTRLISGSTTYLHKTDSHHRPRSRSPRPATTSRSNSNSTDGWKLFAPPLETLEGGKREVPNDYNEARQVSITNEIEKYSTFDLPMSQMNNIDIDALTHQLYQSNGYDAYLIERSLQRERHKSSAGHRVAQPEEQPRHPPRHAAQRRQVEAPSLTADPLATLRTRTMPEHIYAVSRLNPLFLDEESPSPALLRDARTTAAAQDARQHHQGRNEPQKMLQVPLNEEADVNVSPPADHSSLRSSGYGSKENDSASDTSERFVESDSESSKVLPKRGNSSSVSRGSKSHVTNQSSELAKYHKIYHENDGIRSQKNITYKLSELSRSCAHQTRMAETLRGCKGGSTPPIEYFSNPKYVNSVHVGVRRIKSLEAVQDFKGNDFFSKSRETAPRSALPLSAQSRNRNPGPVQAGTHRVTGLNSTYSKMVRRSTSLDHKAKSQTLRFNPLVSVVTQNSRYVTEISVSPRRLNRTSTFNIASSGEQITFFNEPVENDVEHVGGMNDGEERLTRYFGSGLPQHESISSTDYPLMSLQPDSLVTEDTLKMMTYPEYASTSDHSFEPIVPVAHRAADLSQVMYTKGLYATLKRNDLLRNGMVNAPFKPNVDISPKIYNLESSNGHSNLNYKKKGLETVRDLWEKSGLKTNGRKLLVDIDDVSSESKSILSRRGSPAERSLIFENSPQNETSLDAQVVSNVGKGRKDSTKRKNDSTDDLSQSSKDSQPRKKGWKSRSSESLLSSLGINSVSNRTSLENFGLDNFAFTNDNGDRQSVSHFLPRSHAGRWPEASGATASSGSTSEPRHLTNGAPVSQSGFGRNSVIPSNSLQIVQAMENEHSELEEVIVELPATHKPPQNRRTHERRGHLTESSEPVSTLLRSHSSGEHHQRAGQKIETTRRPDAGDSSRARETPLLSYTGTLTTPSDKLATAGPGATSQALPRENGLLNALSGSPEKQAPHQTDSSPEKGEREHLFCKIVSFFQSRGRYDETLTESSHVFGSHGQKSARTSSNKYALHPNSAALNCRANGALCADFTLDAPGAQQPRRKSGWAARKKFVYRTLGVVVALVVFVAVMVALSWYITGGKRLFGPM